MAHVVDTYRVCSDCTLFLANGDLPTDDPKGREHWSDPLPPDSREAAIIGGVERIQAKGGHLVCTSTEETDSDFSWATCQCCLSPLGGSRHDATLLRDGPEPTE